MYDIIELEHWLQQQQGEDPDIKIRARTAKVQQTRQDIKMLSKDSNLCNAGIANILNLPVSVVEREKAKIEEEEEQRRKFMLTGEIEGEGGYFAVLQ